jgi:hypothetical protein
VLLDTRALSASMALEKTQLPRSALNLSTLTSTRARRKSSKEVTDSRWFGFTHNVWRHRWSATIPSGIGPFCGLVKRPMSKLAPTGGSVAVVRSPRPNPVRGVVSQFDNRVVRSIHRNRAQSSRKSEGSRRFKYASAVRNQPRSLSSGAMDVLHRLYKEAPVCARLHGNGRREVCGPVGFCRR